MPTFSVDCVASMVLYENPRDMVRRAAVSFIKSRLNTGLYIVDNSHTNELEAVFEDLPVHYHNNDFNAGYGRAHNWAIEHAEQSKYHLILNPDIVIYKRALENLIDFMNSNPDVGIVAPRVLNEDGSIQYLNKRYPAVFDLFTRRFLPKRLHSLFRRRLDCYEMKDVGYEQVCDVEFLSGCFMLCRTDVLKAVCGFDPRYFMYFEDCDLCRKVQQAGYRTAYFPQATITHLWERASHKSLKMMWVFVVNMCRYFNKWGWKFF